MRQVETARQEKKITDPLHVIHQMKVKSTHPTQSKRHREECLVTVMETSGKTTTGMDFKPKLRDTHSSNALLKEFQQVGVDGINIHSCFQCLQAFLGCYSPE